MNRFARILIIILVGMLPLSAGAISFNLDSIAAWGKFPRFCVNTYRWGDRFFNTYDSTYVHGSGTKFNVKLNTDSWFNHLNFRIPAKNPSERTIDFLSEPSTTMGVYLTYLALSVGYDINVSKLFGHPGHSRQRYQFAFNCSLLSAEAYWERNNSGTRLTRFGSHKGLDMDFEGVSIESWGLDIYYFLNHKKYSQAAAFTYGKIQRRSQGSFYAGFSTYTQSYDIDFSSLPVEMLALLPSWWVDHHYRVRTHNYGIRFGYGYNWVFPRGWMIGVSVSPVLGVSRGNINSDIKSTNFSMYNHAKLGVVWNHDRIFAGAVGFLDTSIVSDRETLFMGSNISFTASVGYRFNLW